MDFLVGVLKVAAIGLAAVVSVAAVAALEDESNHQDTQTHDRQRESRYAPNRARKTSSNTFTYQRRAQVHDHDYHHGSKIILHPRQIRYTQDSISDKWGDYTPHKGESIASTLNNLRRGLIDVSDIPSIRVTYHNGKWYSLDNRRLYLFKKFGESIQCTVWKEPMRSGKGYYGLSIDVRSRRRRDYYN